MFFTRWLKRRRAQQRARLRIQLVQVKAGIRAVDKEIISYQTKLTALSNNNSNTYNIFLRKFSLNKKIYEGTKHWIKLDAEKQHIEKKLRSLR